MDDEEVHGPNWHWDATNDQPATGTSRHEGTNYRYYMLRELNI